jgi:hypothetical protein
MHTTKITLDAFFAGLQDLVKRTGIALATSESLGAYGQMAMVDATDPRGHFLRDPEEPDLIAWHRPDDYVDHAAMPEQTLRPKLAPKDSPFEPDQPLIGGCCAECREPLIDGHIDHLLSCTVGAAMAHDDPTA